MCVKGYQDIRSVNHHVKLDTGFHKEVFTCEQGS